MANRYAVATGNWNSTSTWSATSGGASGASVPGANDAAYINNASYTVTVNTNVSLTHLYVSAGTLNLGNYTMTVLADCSFTGSPTVNLQNGTLSCIERAVQFGTSVNLNAGTSTIIIQGDFSNKTFATGGKTFNEVIIYFNYVAPNSTYNTTISGSGTFRSLFLKSNNSSAHTLYLDDGTTTVNKFIAVGSSSSNKLLIAISNTYHNIAFSSGGSCYAKDITIQADMATSGFPAYIGVGSTDNSNTHLWLTQDPPKIETLTDALTASPGSNSNWTVTGTVVTTTGGEGGGGYTGTNATTPGSIQSTGTYDLVDSWLSIEAAKGSTYREDLFQLFLNNASTTFSSTNVYGRGDVAIGHTDDASSVAVKGMAFSTKLHPLPTNHAISVGSQDYIPSSDANYYSLSQSYRFKINSSGTVDFQHLGTDGTTWYSANRNSVTLTADELLYFKSVRLRYELVNAADTNTVATLYSVNLIAPVTSTPSGSFSMFF